MFCTSHMADETEADWKLRYLPGDLGFNPVGSEDCQVSINISGNIHLCVVIWNV
jgi:hypothetical protein